MNELSRRFFSTSLILLLLIGLGCSTSEKTMRDDTDEQGNEYTETLSELQTLLAENRSQLSDVYTTQQHDMPAIFLQKDSSDASLNDNPFDGYRIQILSTRDQPLADSIATTFRAWSDSTITGYTARSYVFFKQPFYKVHVGDFQARDMANNFARLIKRHYPDAWVVHDRINPNDTPADTASFSYRKTGESTSRELRKK